VGRLREAAPEMIAGGMLGVGHGGLTPEGLKEAAAAALATKVIPAVARGAAQVGRHIDYGLSRIAPAATAAEAVPAAVARTAATGAAAKEAPAGKLINGVQWFGRPATAAERTAAGLPASLHHAIETNNPTFGHAALANEVLGQ